MSVEQAIEHIKRIINSLDGVKYINFDDDNLADNPEWFEDFLFKYHKEINLPYVMNIRAVDISNDTALILKLTGCHEVQIGVECGDENVRKEILKKNVSNDDIINAFNLCRGYKLRTLAYIMHGIPFTTGNQAEQTANLIRKLKPTLIRDTYFYPFVGTMIYRKCLEANLHQVDAGNNYFNLSCFTGDSFEKESFRKLIADDYKIYDHNHNYLELVS